MTAIKQESSTESPEIGLFKLLDKASEEIATYRQRQITMFREAAIVEALITWGVNQLKLQPNGFALSIRVAAAVACLGASIIGGIIILSYKERIYHIRSSRARLAERIQRQLDGNSDAVELFYPTAKKSSERFLARLASIPTSHIYILTLMILGILAAVVNLLAGRAIQ